MTREAGGMKGEGRRAKVTGEGKGRRKGGQREWAIQVCVDDQRVASDFDTAQNKMRD